ncbi:hypothetical protein BDN70DRAFT_872734 [Pholiota conissans]|uniref:Uncharacterized protein n=1 Tax=Pholiota conissans TaxID=109636 RepID=A0A9P5ZD21_9AGAR|nr:hypothetical protein BDN70DRAFT_872734 [Pholiota conissans]
MRLRQVEAEAAEQQEILAMGSPDTFSIDRLEIAPLPNASDEQSPTLFPSIAFQTLLSYPILTELRFQHWSLPPIDEFLAEQSTASHPQPLSMEKLRLPVDNTLYPGIMVSTLEAITRYYPRLIDFECLIQTISSSQVAHLNDPPQIFSRGLEFLSVGGILPSSLDDKISMASHLCLLFPKLKKIRTHDGYDADGWRVVQSLVRMHQNLRTVEEGVRR